MMGMEEFLNKSDGAKNNVPCRQWTHIHASPRLSESECPPHIIDLDQLCTMIRQCHQIVPSPARLLELQVSQRGKNDATRGNRQPGPNVTSIVPNLNGNWVCVPDLVHSNNRTSPSAKESKQGRRTDRKLLLVFPESPVEWSPSQ